MLANDRCLIYFNTKVIEDNSSVDGGRLTIEITEQYKGENKRIIRKPYYTDSSRNAHVKFSNDMSGYFYNTQWCDGEELIEVQDPIPDITSPASTLISLMQEKNNIALQKNKLISEQTKVIKKNNYVILSAIREQNLTMEQIAASIAADRAPTINNDFSVPENSISVNVTQDSPTVNVEAPIVNNTNNVESPTVNVSAPQVTNNVSVPDSAISVNVTQDSPTVNVEAPIVNNTNNVEAPQVTNNVSVPDSAIAVNVTQDSPTVNVSAPQVTNNVSIPDSAIAVSVTQDSPTVNVSAPQVTNNIDTTDIKNAITTIGDTNTSINTHLTKMSADHITNAETGYYAKATIKNDAVKENLDFEKDGIATLKDTNDTVVKPREAKALLNAEKHIDEKRANTTDLKPMLQSIEDDHTDSSLDVDIMSDVIKDLFSTDNIADTISNNLKEGV